MAKGRLIAGTVVALGVAAELLGGVTARGLAVADLLTGIAAGLGGAWLLRRAGATADLAVATAVAWFAGTLDGSANAALDAIGGVCVLAYRGPLLHLLLRVVGGRVARGLVVAAWLGAFLPSTVTIAVAAATGAVALAHARRAGADRRRALLAAAACAIALAALWTAALEGGGSTALTLLNDGLVIATVSVGLAAASGLWARAAASRLVVALDRDRHPGRPVTAQLARALADPDLELCYAVPGLGWVDERGQPVTEPDGRVVSRAAAPGGAEVALVHGGTADPRLVAAATAAAALALDSARLEAELRATAAGVRASRRRLLTTADDERRTLGEQLETRVLARLRRVEPLLADDRARAELEAVRGELAALGTGLYPPALRNGTGIAEALNELVARAVVPTDVIVDGEDDLPAGHRAALWFVCAEALANVDKHAGAASATLRLRLSPRTVTLELADDGRGGAVPRRGLRGIGDRVEALGGHLEITSPPGGPTVVTAVIPR
ncbi:sensor histidine kinase [Solirubrobacter soli]|uniref:sensor histidine kinase n=1 Tax=Solirubrobacter soli TaxID=363832 RepID=UPI000408C5E6|nr:hypothetical protein [Solirubrobacter soli]